MYGGENVDGKTRISDQETGEHINGVREGDQWAAKEKSRRVLVAHVRARASNMATIAQVSLLACAAVRTLRVYQ